eukprot:Rmarinus@m.72
MQLTTGSTASNVRTFLARCQSGEREWRAVFVWWGLFTMARPDRASTARKVLTKRTGLVLLARTSTRLLRLVLSTRLTVYATWGRTLRPRKVTPCNAASVRRGSIRILSEILNARHARSKIWLLKKELQVLTTVRVRRGTNTTQCAFPATQAHIKKKSETRSAFPVLTLIQPPTSGAPTSLIVSAFLGTSGTRRSRTRAFRARRTLTSTIAKYVFRVPTRTLTPLKDLLSALAALGTAAMPAPLSHVWSVNRARGALGERATSATTTRHPLQELRVVSAFPDTPVRMTIVCPVRKTRIRI